MTGLPDYTLDHIGMLFHDLDHAERLYNRLGFKLTPRTVLKKEDDFGRTTPSGLSNQHVMLKTGYLELAAVTHPEAGNPLADRVTEYQGVHIIVFGSSPADEARVRIQSSGFQIQEPAVAQRTLYFIDPPGKAKFKWFPIPWWELIGRPLGHGRALDPRGSQDD